MVLLGQAQRTPKPTMDFNLSAHSIIMRFFSPHSGSASVTYIDVWAAKEFPVDANEVLWVVDHAV